MPDDDDVGYKKPPKKSQFKPGQSGNPKGRPKGHKNFETDVQETLKAPVKVKNDGGTETVTTQKAVLLRLREQALGGNARARDRLIELARVHNAEELAAAASTALAASDQAILDGYADRIRRHARNQGRPADQSDPPGKKQNDKTVDEDDA